jgi:hypothetical protein
MLIIFISFNVDVVSISLRLMKILVDLCTALAIHNDHMVTFKTEHVPLLVSVEV